MKDIEKSPPHTVRDIERISAIVADPALSHAGARLAVALVLMADDAGEAKGRTVALADASRIERRRIVGHLRRLEAADYVRLIDTSRPGRFHVELSDVPLERRRFIAAIDAALGPEDSK
jgi:hypothetical protein